MSAIDDFKREWQHAWLLSWIRPALTLAAIVVGIPAAFYFGKHSQRTDTKVQVAKDTVRITDSVRSVVAETVKVRLAAKLRTDTLVQVVTDTQLVVRETPAAPPETVAVLEPIVDRIRKCDAFASSCQVQLRADSAEIRALKNLVAIQQPPKCSRKCGFVLGVLSSVVLYKAIK